MILKLLFYYNFLIIINIINCSEYCDLESLFCFGKKHIGCEVNEFSLTNEYDNFQLIEMTSDLRGTILNEINEYRNRIALGKIKGFPMASSMKVMIWYTEFEELMEIAIEKVDYRKFFCVATTENILPYEIQYKITGSFQPIDFLRRAMRAFMKSELKSPEETNFSSFYLDENRFIGCAYATFNATLGETHLLKCLTNKWAEKNLEDAYEKGEPCSDCINYEVCSDFYAGLCDYAKTGQMGPIGLQGVPGPPGNCAIENESDNEL